MNTISFCCKHTCRDCGLVIEERPSFEIARSTGKEGEDHEQGYGRNCLLTTTKTSTVQKPFKPGLNDVVYNKGSHKKVSLETTCGTREKKVTETKIDAGQSSEEEAVLPVESGAYASGFDEDSPPEAYFVHSFDDPSKDGNHEQGTSPHAEILVDNVGETAADINHTVRLLNRMCHVSKKQKKMPNIGTKHEQRSVAGALVTPVLDASAVWDWKTLSHLSCLLKEVDDGLFSFPMSCTTIRDRLMYLFEKAVQRSCYEKNTTSAIL